MSLQAGGGGRKQYNTDLLYSNDTNTSDSLFCLFNIIKILTNKSIENETNVNVRVMLLSI